MLRRLAVALVLTLVAAGPARADSRGVREAGTNLTRPVRKWLKSYDKKTAIAALPASAKDNRYVLVKGLFGDNYPGYMKKNLAALHDSGLTAEYAPVNTAASVAENKAVLKNMIRTSDRPIVFVTHSKGTSDATAAIAELYKEDPALVKAKVRGLVSLQGAYGGSPVADWVASHPFTRGLTHLLGGSPESVFDLQTSVRHAATAEAPMPTDVVPTISMVGWGPHYHSALGAGVALMKLGFGQYSDGLVATRDAVIPGSDVVRVPVDHAKAAFGRHSERLTLGLVKHVLEMPRMLD
jgi:triacylglycerol lipase